VSWSAKEVSGDLVRDVLSLRFNVCRLLNGYCTSVRLYSRVTPVCQDYSPFHFKSQPLTASLPYYSAARAAVLLEYYIMSRYTPLDTSFEAPSLASRARRPAKPMHTLTTALLRHNSRSWARPGSQGEQQSPAIVSLSTKYRW
jgi:hypothetical protein